MLVLVPVRVFFSLCISIFRCGGSNELKYGGDWLIVGDEGSDDDGGGDVFRLLFFNLSVNVRRRGILRKR
jgi:hypothetical protein